MVLDAFADTMAPTLSVAEPWHALAATAGLLTEAGDTAVAARPVSAALADRCRLRTTGDVS